MRPEDAPAKMTNREASDRLIQEGEAAMERSAAEKARNNNLNSRKRGGDEKNDLNKRNPKKLRKLKHQVAEDDWGLEVGEIDE